MFSALQEFFINSDIGMCIPTEDNESLKSENFI